MPNMSQPKLMKMTKKNLPIKLKNSLIIHKEKTNNIYVFWVSVSDKDTAKSLITSNFLNQNNSKSKY